MEIKDYQQRVLNQIEAYLQALDREGEKKRKLIEAKIDIEHDAPAAAWRALNFRKDYKTWKNGLGEDTPSVCLKVPTGGGKTYLAARSIGLINLNYRKERTGFVLWIMPSNQIYKQTLAAMRNREHFYRQVLDQISGGKTLILEKTDRFNRQQANEHLIVMLLMLPSANRMDKETLKVFQDSAGFESFFPPEDASPAHAEMLSQFPNLDHFGSVKQFTGVAIKTSLGNTLRILKPLIILDEGHKSYSAGARKTIQTFNPCFVLELSATPKKESNILVEVTGQELNREEMIKLDLNIMSKASPDWRDTLLTGFEQIQKLDSQATEYRNESGRYIRPICLIQVERTGKKQDTGQFIHANDAMHYLIEKCGVNPGQIAIKSAENDGLEDIDLLSPESRIQYIITKSALQEGWDCPFAYVLVILTKATSKTALTQLVGRILRQPDAKKTGMKSLDESYVYCYQRNTREVLSAIEQGFEKEGLGDLRGHIRQAENEVAQTVDVRYRERFRKFEGKIYLPRFVVQEAEGFRSLSYEMDILRYIDWNAIDIPANLNVTLGVLSDEDRQTKVGLSDNPYKLIEEHHVETHDVVLDIDFIFVTRQLSDIVPNAWIAYKIAKDTFNLFLAKHPEAQVSANIALIIGQLRQLLITERDRLAHREFRKRIENKQIFFFLEATTDFALPSTVRVKANGSKLVQDNNDPIQLSLFEYEQEDAFNNTEKAVAIYLDKQANLLWWYRNLVGKQSYKIQGWQPPPIYADFLAAKKDDSNAMDYSKVFVLETKGLHLKGNPDTEYKRNIFDLCTELGKSTDWASLGEDFGKKEVEFQIVYEDEWQTKINELFID